MAGGGSSARDGCRPRAVLSSARESAQSHGVGAKVHPPSWLPESLCYETMMGSVAYGVSSESSDIDVYGICIPPKEMVFPHLAGEIFGFWAQLKRFET